MVSSKKWVSFLEAVAYFVKLFHSVLCNVEREVADKLTDLKMSESKSPKYPIFVTCFIWLILQNPQNADGKCQIWAILPKKKTPYYMWPLCLIWKLLVSLSIITATIHTTITDPEFPSHKIIA